MVSPCFVCVCVFAACVPVWCLRVPSWHVQADVKRAGASQLHMAYLNTAKSQNAWLKSVKIFWTIQAKILRCLECHGPSKTNLRIFANSNAQCFMRCFHRFLLNLRNNVWLGRAPRGSCNRTLLRRVLRRLSNSKCFLEGFLEGACKGFQ